MTKRKLTADDKKSLLIKFFQDQNEFFSIKELEKSVPKETGINEKQVKEILQQVLDDGTVESEKVEGTILYWSFANKSTKDFSRKCDNHKEKLKDLDKRVEDLKSKKDKVAKQEGVEVLATENDLLRMRVKILTDKLKLSGEQSAIAQSKEDTSDTLAAKKEWIPVRNTRIVAKRGGMSVELRVQSYFFYFLKINLKVLDP